MNYIALFEITLLHSADFIGSQLHHMYGGAAFSVTSRFL